MRKTDGMLRASPLLWLLICGLALSGCATSGPAAKPAFCPQLPPPPPNVMRSPRAESALRERLFESGERPTIN